MIPSSIKLFDKSNVKSFCFLPERIILPNYIKVDKFLQLMEIDNELIIEFKKNCNSTILGQEEALEKVIQ